MFLQSTTNAAMEKAMSAVWERRNVVANNLANEDTPGYKAQRLDFEAALQAEISSLRNTRSAGDRASAIARLNNVLPTITQDTGTIGRADGNNVDVLAEQVEMARVEYQYQALTQRVSSYYSTLKYAISGGR